MFRAPSVHGPDEYAWIAPLYDRVTGPALAGLRREVAALVGRQAEGPVLDVCCGTGVQLRALLDLGLNAYGVDLSPAMLGRAKGLVPPGRLLLADAARLPVPDAAAGACTLTLALHEKPAATAQAIFSQMVRAARPGAPLIIADYAAPNGPLARAASLAVAGVERLAGAHHFACYRAFMAEGGLEGFLSRQKKTRYTVVKRPFGLIALALVRAG